MRISNAGDYTPEELARALNDFTQAKAKRILTERYCLLGKINGLVIATISYTPGRLRTLFVDPDWQRQGIGHTLTQRIEDHARQDGVSVLEVSSSLTAEGFYRRRGYILDRVDFEGTERCPVYHLKL